MGHSAGQLSDRFEPLRLAQRKFGRFALFGLVVQPVRAAKREREQ